MKILHLLSSPHLGGAEVMALLLARAQTFAGHDVLVHLLAGGETLDFAIRESVPHMLRAVPDETHGKSEKWRAQEALLRQTVAEFSPEIVHSHVPKTNLTCHRTLPELKIPWVTTIHGSWRQFAYSPAAARRPMKKPWLLLRHAVGDHLSTRSAEKVIAISGYVRRQLLQIGVSRQKLSIVHDGLPFNPGTISKADARREFDIPDKALAIGSLGHFAPVKGFDLLIDAFARIAGRFPEALLLIAGGDILGDSQVRHGLADQIIRATLTGRIRLLDRLNTRQGFLRALDLFAVTSRTEGFSLSLVEAMQHGLPGVVTSAGGCAEAARPDQEALLFRSGNADDLAAKLVKLLSDADLRHQFGSAAQKRAAGYLTLNRCAQEYEKEYKEILTR